jgi:uncharacterized protein
LRGPPSFEAPGLSQWPVPCGSYTIIRQPDVGIGEEIAMCRSLIVAAAATLALTTGGAAAADMKIVTASSRGTYIQIGRDLASLVAPVANIGLEVLPSAGSAENVRRLRYESGVKLAIVQSDVYQAFLDQAALGNAEAGRIIKPLRVVLPLYNEEIYFVVRADADLQHVHEIRPARINLGELGSGTALTTSTLYRLMFDVPVPDANASFLANEDALVKLIGDKTVDVVAIIAGQPAKLLVDMKPEARQMVKLLKFDAAHPASQAALKTYFNATVRAASYPNLLTEDLPALAVKAMLVTYDYESKASRDSLGRFARALCNELPALRDKGHPKWREVDIAMPDLGRGWSYFQATSRELTACTAQNAVGVRPRPARDCSQHERVLGLCESTGAAHVERREPTNRTLAR